MKKRIGSISPSELIQEIKRIIESLAPPNLECAEGRTRLYLDWAKLPTRDQLDMLKEILSAQIAQESTPKTEKGRERAREIETMEEREREARKKARKSYEYIQRSLAQGKLPQKPSPDPLSLKPENPPHLRQSIETVNMYDLSRTLERIGIRAKYETLKEILEFFFNKHISVESLKRELARLRKNPPKSAF